MRGAGKYAATVLALAAGASGALLAPGAGADTTTTTTTTTTTPASVTMTVTPGTPLKGSTVVLSAANVPAQGTSLPQSVTVTLPGFSTATAKGVADSVSTLCTAAQASAYKCPAAAQVGTGSATIVATLQPAYQAFNPGPVTATLAGYLEAPTQAGAVADVALVFSTKYGTQEITGYLESAASGLTVSVPSLGSLSSQFAAYQSYIQSVNLQSLSLTLGAHTTVSTVTRKTVKERVRERIKERVRHNKKYVTKYVIRYVTKRVVKKTTVKSTAYLLINPKTCTTAGWTGTLALGYSSGPVSYSATAACSA